MSGARTVLLAVREGRIWRVQIVWPNGSVHYFGKFNFEQEARAWVGAHAWLTAANNEAVLPRDDREPAGHRD